MKTPASETTGGRKSALRQGLALPPASPGGKPGFPVKDANHWDKALEAVGRTGGGARRHALAKLLKKTAPRFGKSIKGTWVESDLAGSGASMANGVRGSVNLAGAWIPSKEYWADHGGSDEEKADNHIAAARKASSVGNHAAAYSHLSRAAGLTNDSGKQASIQKMQKGIKTIGGVPPTTPLGANAQAAAAANPGAGMSNKPGQPYDLAARYRALQFADDGDNDIDDFPKMGELQCPNCGYHSDSADFKIAGQASGTSDPAKPGALQTPDGGNQSSTGFNPGSAGLNVASKGGSYGSMSNSRNGIELSRRSLVTSASDIVVSRGTDGSAVIRHRRGGETIGQIQRLADGKWGGRIEGGSQLDPRQHQRAALLDLIGGWNRGATTPFRQAVPLQQPPAQTPLMAQFGVPAVRVLANSDDSGDSSGSDSGSGGSGPAGLSPKGVTIYKKLIAKGFPPARALAFARNSEKASSGSFKKAS